MVLPALLACGICSGDARPCDRFPILQLFGKLCRQSLEQPLNQSGQSYLIKRRNRIGTLLGTKTRRSPLIQELRCQASDLGPPRMAYLARSAAGRDLGEHGFPTNTFGRLLGRKWGNQIYSGFAPQRNYGPRRSLAVAK